ncbi:hypothetical protein GCM10010387_49920 [Streptomyces inusitatus]|uniref:Uncharacterized protein n=1 Tax=Streptomyces inusitatus TaxID=68221 RepID=A0A918UZY7_9ACTN|nr:hypothetical protein [Streptomyces inusitatus]GGZ49668.1 hypothetical protein GCM10010387_49920 [Streptomyces inusitatus]
MQIDPAVDRAILRAVGHSLPATPQERASVASLNIRNTETVSRLELFPSLQRLIITGWDPVSMQHFRL